MKSLSAFSISLFLSVTVLLAALFGNRVLAQSPMRAAGNSCPVTWQAVPHPDVGNLSGVEAIAPDNVWVSGNGGLLHWNGASWQLRPNPFWKPATLLASLPNGDLWALSGQTLLHWDGEKWEQVGQDPVYANDIAVLAPDDIWAASGFEAAHWDGSQWAYYRLPNTYENVFMNSITALAPDKVWVVGSVGHLNMARAYFWDGTQWTQATELSDIPSYYRAVSASSFDNVWVIGVKPDAVTAQRFNGTNWEGHDTPLTYSDFNVDVKAFAPDDVYIVGGEILHWDGNAWSVLPSPTNTLDAISASSPTDLWTVGGTWVVHGTLPCATPVPTPLPTETPCLVFRPKLIHPKDKAVLAGSPISMRWEEQECAKNYIIEIRRDSVKGKKILRTAVTNADYNAGWLGRGHEYYWRVRACNSRPCTRWSEWRSFTIQP